MIIPMFAYSSQKRQEALDDFTKDFYKLKNNSLFGKTLIINNWSCFIMFVL
jgi:hypothetical protein